MNTIATSADHGLHSIERVVASGICVGCGACAVATRGNIAVRRSELGYMQADLGSASQTDLSAGGRVCPFSDDALDEDALARSAFANATQHDGRVGFFEGIYAGRVEGDVNELKKSSSGGLTSWLTIKLLENGRIDGVIHVAEDPASDDLFAYCVSRTSTELQSRRKSQYYSTTLASVLQAVRGDGRRYAVVGVPCFIKAARLLTRVDPVLHEQLAYFIGLVCGHLKSSGFAEALAWQAGVEPRRLAGVDFRVKAPGKSAGDYGFAAREQGSSELRVAPTRQLLGGNWGHAMFQLSACDYCDDVFVETADIAFGDAWLPKYSDDWRGTNVVVCRNAELEHLLAAGAERGEITLESLPVEEAVESQSGNFRHRWDGLSIRLADDVAAGKWVPKKRIAPGSRSVSASRKRIVRLRRELSRLSHLVFREARQAGSFEVFRQRTKPLVEAMNREYVLAGGSRLKNMARRMKWWLSGMLGSGSR